MTYLRKINGKAEPEKKAIINQKRIITFLHIEKKIGVSLKKQYREIRWSSSEQSASQN